MKSFLETMHQRFFAAFFFAAFFFAAFFAAFFFAFLPGDGQPFPRFLVAICVSP
jgi:hypothetical protein